MIVRCKAARNIVLGPIRNFSFAAAITVSWVLTAAGCDRPQPPAPIDGAEAAPASAAPAPPPPEVPSSDPSAQTTQRAAPPMPPAVALGEFAPADPAAEAATGRLTIEDMAIRGANGAGFVTERAAIVRGNDQYNAQSRYADSMLVVPEQTIELRRVVERTPSDKPSADPFCGADKTGYLALAKVAEGDTDVIKLMALRGDSLPAASAPGVTLCKVFSYTSAKK